MFVTSIYRNVMKRTSTFTLTILIGALVFERGFDQLADYGFESMNRGKLWDHIKHKYETSEE